MGVVDQGRSLNRYNLGQRRKKGFLTDSNRNVQFDKRIGRKPTPPKKTPRPDGLQLTKARKKEMIKRSIPLLIVFVLGVILAVLWAIWLLN